MPDHDVLAADVVSAVAGDLDAFRRLLAQKHDVNLFGAGAVSNLMLGTTAIYRVLTAFAEQAAAPSIIQEWASFVRRGFIAPVGKACIAPLTIDYEPAFEDEIVEIIHRLDEIGDSIAGEVTAEEISAMLRTLPPGELG